ncbi:MAG: hypothetical protein JSR39_00280 [Verrucomicrobia bacterium]|nr:hypothetical protein [Verrucomicrobiota bacterium]
MSSSSFITTSNLTCCSSSSHSQEQPTTQFEPLALSELDSRSQTAFTRGRSQESQNDAVFSRQEFSHIGTLQDHGQNRLDRLLGMGKDKNIDLRDLRDFDRLDPDHKMACVRQSAKDAYSRLNEESQRQLCSSIMEMSGSSDDLGSLDWGEKDLFENLAVFSSAYNRLPEESRNGHMFSFETSPFESPPSLACSSSPVDPEDRDTAPYGEAGLPTVDHVATLAPSIDDALLKTMDTQKSIDPNLFHDLKNDLGRYAKGDPKFKKNALATIELLEKFSQLIFQYDQNRIPFGNVCREIKKITSDAGIGLHLDNYTESSSSRLPNHKVLVETIRNTVLAVQTCYLDAKNNNLLPVLFITAFGSGSCFDTRTEVINVYADAINYNCNVDLKNEKLLELAVKAYSARMNQNKLPVDFDAFLDYLNEDMGLELGCFHIQNENPRENPIVRKLTLSGYFKPMIEEGFFHEMMQEYICWPASGNNPLQTKSGDEGYTKEVRAVFRKILIETENPLLEEINEQNVDRHIDNFIRLNRELLARDLGNPIDESAAILIPQLFRDWKQSGEKSELDRRDKNFTKENRAYFAHFLLANQSISDAGINKDIVDNYVDNFIREKRSHDKSIEQVLGQPKDEGRISSNTKRRNAARGRTKGPTPRLKARVEVQSTSSSDTTSSTTQGRKKRSNAKRR